MLVAKWFAQCRHVLARTAAQAVNHTSTMAKAIIKSNAKSVYLINRRLKSDKLDHDVTIVTGKGNISSVKRLRQKALTHTAVKTNKAIDILRSLQLGQLASKWLHLIGKPIKEHKVQLISGVLTACVAGGVWWGTLAYIESNTVDYYRIYVDGTEIGQVQELELVTVWFDEKRKQINSKNNGIQMEIDEEGVAWLAASDYKFEFDDRKVFTALEEKIEPYAIGVELWINDEMVGLVQSEEVANAIIKVSELEYLDQREEANNLTVSILSSVTDVVVSGPASDFKRSVLKDIYIQEEVFLTKVRTQPDQLDDPSEILEKIKLGSTEEIQHTVEAGDCISCIAYQYSVSESFIYERNPWIQNDLLNIGDLVDLTVVNPKLTVITVELIVEEMETPFEVIYEQNVNMLKGKSRVVQEGISGWREVTSLVTKANGDRIDEVITDVVILEEPISKIVVQGTKVVNGVGTGNFAWPTRSARVTSNFGMRWGKLHQGIDLVSKNRSIYAADDGVVEFAGHRGGYGTTIILNHKNGYKTLYAHLNSFDVRRGQIVEKGAKIGVMGRTGQATGIHLHFEILRNGQAQNPRKYL